MLIGTAPDAPEYQAGEGDFEELARDLNCGYFCDADVDGARGRDLIQAAGADLAISLNWPRLIDRATIDRFPRGILNLHVGDLPRFRGNATTNWAILAGESQVVITVHLMTEQLDAGPIVLKRAVPLDEGTYVSDVHRSITGNVGAMFVAAIAGLESGLLIPQPQPEDPALALRGFPRLPIDSQIDWRLPAVDLARLVRASAEPFAGAYTTLAGQRLTVWRARHGRLPYAWLGAPGQVASRDVASGDVVTLTGRDVLILEELELDGGGRQPASRVIRSTRARLGST